MQGQIPRLIKELTRHVFFKTRISFTTKRKQDENAAARLLIIEFRGRFVDTKKIHLDRFVEEGLKSETTTFGKAAKRVKVTLDDMADAFVERDQLLKTSGPLTVYYWLFRTYSGKHKDQIREFLVKFDRERAENRKLLTDVNRDDELLEYDITIRSSNDQGSMTRSYNILRRRFEMFLKS